jgi:hypothetical protein
MALPTPLAAFLRAHGDLLLGALLVAVLLLAVALLWTGSRLGRLNRLYTRLTRGTSGGTIEEILTEHIQAVMQVQRRMDDLSLTVSQIGDTQLHCLQKVGLVRFDAFEDVGGQQSFAVALLDAERTGMTISSVFSRSDVRVYAKAIRSGAPSHPLTVEEQQAVAQAEGHQ